MVDFSALPVEERQPEPPDDSGDLSAAELAERLEHVGVYEREGETYRAHRYAPDAGPASADYLVRRDSDGRYGGYIVDLALDGGNEIFGPEDVRYEAYDDRGQYAASAVSLRGVLSVFAQPGRMRWISDRTPERELEAE